MSLADVPVCGEVVLRGGGVRIAATVTQQGSDWLRCGWTHGAVALTALVMHDGRVTSVDADFAPGTTLRAEAATPLPPAETWHLTLASGARVAVICTPERDEEYECVCWVARATPWGEEYAARSHDSPEGAVHVLVGALGRRVRRIEPPAPETVATASRFADETQALAHFDEIAAPEPDAAAVERAAVVAMLNAEAADHEAMESSRGDVVALALRVMATKIAARGAP